MQQHTAVIAGMGGDAGFGHDFHQPIVEGLPVVAHFLRPIVVSELFPYSLVGQIGINGTGPQGDETGHVVVFNYVPHQANNRSLATNPL